MPHLNDLLILFYLFYNMNIKNTDYPFLYKR